jgi:hypothetical protein
MLSVKNRLAATAAFLSIVSLGTASMNVPSADAAVISQTSATIGTIAHRDRDDRYEDDRYGDDRYEDDRYNGSHDRRDNGHGAREIYSDSKSDPNVIIYTPNGSSNYHRPRRRHHQQRRNCVQTLYAVICN